MMIHGFPASRLNAKMKSGRRSRLWKIASFAGAALFMLATSQFMLGLPANGTSKAAAEGPGGYADTIFDQLNQKNGLPNAAAQAITQDADGFMWIGTESGVSRWDGYHFRTYSMQPGVTGSLPSNDVLTLYMDPQKRLWIGTNHGLARYDAAQDRFQTFTPTGPGGTYPSIYSMVTDGARGLWLATRKGLDHFDPDTGAFKREPMPGIEGNAANTQAVVRDPDGHIWAGSTKGLFYSDASGHNYKAVTVVTGKAPRIWSLMRDHEGRLWIGATAGAFVLEPGATLPRPIHETGYVTPPAGTTAPDNSATSPLDTQGVDTMIEAEPGIVWLATYGEGIVEVDTSTWLTHRIVHQPSISTSLSHDLVDAMFRDRAGTVWAGSLNGLSRRNPTGKGFLTFFGGTGDAAHPIVDSDITALMPTADGRLWLGLGDKGIEVFDQSGKRLNNAPPPKPALKMQLVSGFAQAPDGTMYFGSQQGLYRADRDGNHIQTVSFTSINPTIQALIYDAGTLWVGSGQGLWAVPLPAGTKQNRPALQAKPFLPTPITAMTRGQGNDLWVGTGASLYRVDLKTQAVTKTDITPNKPGALPSAITALMVDRAGRLWVSTDGTGLYQSQGANAQGQLQFLKRSTADAGQTFEMPDGRICFPGDQGIEVFDPKTLALTRFSQPDGVAFDSFWLSAGAIAPDGRLILGGGGGLTIVQPQRIHPWSFAAPVVVTQFSTGEKLNSQAQYLANSGSGVVQIQPHANSFEVEFAALDFSDPEANNYAYRLVGFDHDWITTDSSRRIARYTNLSPGSYTFEVKGSNRYGVWGTTRSIAIRILPAWYQTIWAKFAAILAGIALVFWLFRVYTAILRARQRHLERQVALRTIELEELTVKLQLSQHELERIAYSDSLTGLSNRRMFADCFQQLLAAREQQADSFTLLLIDLDNFKAINDGYGHDIGDALLCEIANRLNKLAHENDCVARLGGDEFALLLANTADDAAIDKVCRDILHALDDPFVLNNISLQPTVSIGAAVYPQDGTEQDSLFKSADLALYEVKRQGRNGWRRYTIDFATASQ